MEWAMVNVNLLGLAQDKAVRARLIEILKELANKQRETAQ
jgi:hypothetical protein